MHLGKANLDNPGSYCAADTHNLYGLNRTKSERTIYEHLKPASQSIQASLRARIRTHCMLYVDVEFQEDGRL